MEDTGFPELPVQRNWRLLSDYSQMAEVKVVLPGLAWAGRIGLVHGPPAGGKTMLAANAVARLSRGNYWLGKRIEAGTAVVFTEDHSTWLRVMDASPRGWDRNGVWVPDRYDDFDSCVRDVKPALAVVDTFDKALYCRGLSDGNSAGEVNQILRPLETLARETGAALMVLDHEPHGVARPRGSGAKAATVDYMLRCHLNNPQRPKYCILERSGEGKVRLGLDAVRRVNVTPTGSVIGNDAV